MFSSVITTLIIILPLLNGQVYFPMDDKDDSKGFYLPELASKNVAEAVNSASVDVPRGITKLALKIEKYLLQDNNNNYDNMVFSPASISVALAVMLMGSNGQTYRELLDILGVTNIVSIPQVHQHFGEIIHRLEAPPLNGGHHKLNFATAIFLQNDFAVRKEFQDAAISTYDSEVFKVDFQHKPVIAQQTINSWVEESTEGKINELLSEIPAPSTKIILANALYFKAKWVRGFIEEATRRSFFYTNGWNDESSKVMVDLMYNGGPFPYFNDTDFGCEILGMPYEGDKSTMYVVIPHNSNKKTLRELEMKLTTSDISRLVNSTVKTELIIAFPKMRIEQTYDLKEILDKIGLHSLFQPTANLALIANGFPLLNRVLLNRNGEEPTNNCTMIFDPNTSLTACQETAGNQTVTYKKFGTKVGRRIVRDVLETQEILDKIRLKLNESPNSEREENPGLFVDSAIHKVFIGITEYGTEAAAATAFSTSRSKTGRVLVQVPFLFFIMNDETKTILFHGSVHKPTPSY